MIKVLDDPVNGALNGGDVHVFPANVLKILLKRMYDIGGDVLDGAVLLWMLLEHGVDVLCQHTKELESPPLVKDGAHRSRKLSRLHYMCYFLYGWRNVTHIRFHFAISVYRFDGKYCGIRFIKIQVVAKSYRNSKGLILTCY